MMVKLLKIARTSRAGRTALASYFAFGTAALNALISIPIAVAYLERDQIGLWTIVSQFVSYLLWFDLGVGDAVGRKMAEPIAKNDQLEINQWWGLSLGVLGFQALLLAPVAIVLWPLWISWFEIKDGLLSDAAWLYTGSVMVAMISLPLRAYPGVLMAQNRYHWVPLAQGVMPLVQLCLFYLLLRAGWGVKAFFISLLASQIVGWGIFVTAVHVGPVRLGFARSGFTRERLGSLFSLSGSIALIGLSQTVTNSLPAVLLGRFGGLALVPVYGFTGRVPGMCMNLSKKTSQAFYPALQRFYVDGDRDRFLAKFREVSALVVSMSLVVAGVIIAGNRSVISWLASPDYFAGSMANIWFGLAVITAPFSQNMISLLNCSGRMGKSAVVAVGRLGVGAGLGWLGYRQWGLPGLAAVFALLPMFTIGLYAMIRGARNCGFGVWDICGKGIRYMLGAGLLTVVGGWWVGVGAEAHSEVELLGRVTVLPGLREIVVVLVFGVAGVVMTLSQLRRIRAV